MILRSITADLSAASVLQWSRKRASQGSIEADGTIFFSLMFTLSADVLSNLPVASLSLFLCAVNTFICCLLRSKIMFLSFVYAELTEIPFTRQTVSSKNDQPSCGRSVSSL